MATALGSFVVGEVLGADDMNVISTWSSFTVTTTGSANMTFTGTKCVVNKLCVFEIIGTATGAATPPVTVTLPEAMASLNGAVGFQAGFYDDSAAVWYYGPMQRSSGTIVQTRVWNASATYLTATQVTNLIPFTWAVNDLFILTGTYRMS
jgi:hypothetical protein